MLSSWRDDKSAKDENSSSNGSDLAEERKPNKPIVKDLKANRKIVDELSDRQIQQ